MRRVFSQVRLFKPQTVNTKERAMSFVGLSDNPRLRSKISLKYLFCE